MPLTEEQKRAYLEAKREMCPYCKSSDIRPDREVDMVDLTARQFVRCLSCRKEWVDCFALVGIEESE